MTQLQPSHRLITLGGLALVDADGRAEPSLATRKRKLALLVWLALTGKPASRDRLIGVFWGEREEERARNSLSDALSSLRRILGRSALPAYRDQVMLAEDTLLTVDVLELQAAAQRGEHDRVIDLYAGPFLDGVYVDAAPDFEKWSDQVRQRVDALFARACRARCNELARAGSWTECETIARRWLSVESASGEAAMHLLNAIVAPGTHVARVAAVREHAALSERVARELGVGLDPAVTARARELADEVKIMDDAQVSAIDSPAAPATVTAATEPADPLPRSGRLPPRRPWVKSGIAGAAATLALVALIVTRGGDETPASRARAVDRGGGVPDPHSVAVLRFRNIGGDSADQYFSDGIAEEVMDAIGRLRGVQVAPRSASFPLSADTIDVREIARRLNVATVLEGSVRRGGARLRVSVRLVSALESQTLWHGTYDRTVQDAITVQEEVARAVAGALQVELGQLREADRRRRVATDFQTYDLYLRGRYAWWNASTEEGVRRGIAHFRRALARDSAFAPAWAGLAGAQLELTAMHDVAPTEVVPQARAALLRARSLDSSLADAHALLGYVATVHDRRWEDAEASFRRALALDPRHTSARLWYAWMLAARGRHDEAVREIRHAREYEPTSELLSARLATMLYFARDFEGAIELTRASIETDSRFWLQHRQLGEALVQIGQLREAVASLRHAATMSPTGETRARLAYGLARAGDTTAARALLTELRESGYVSPVELARVHVALGEHTLALQLLERAAEIGASTVVMLNVEPAFDPLRRDVRFRSLVHHLGL
ncbi:MAG TPA: tetratricopeptide repeat protein [Gemmatimonadaceae bacterium]|nr:tetratricopeptide repeat protein [Gemmatimonadaceae bacterium]